MMRKLSLRGLLTAFYVFFLLLSNINAQFYEDYKNPGVSPHPYLKKERGKSEKVIPRFTDKTRDPWIKPLPEKKGELLFDSLGDTTPPTTPANVVAVNESTYIVLCTWDASEDPESGIDYYAFGIGTAPGEADIKWWQSSSLHTEAYFYPLESGCKEGDTIYISVRATNKDNLDSGLGVSNPVCLTREVLGEPTNNLLVAYTDYGFDTDGVTLIEGWNASQIDRFEYFTARMIPIIKDIYGPPAHNYTVTLVRNLYYDSSSVFFSQYNEIHMDDSWEPQLLTHELIHAFRDNVTITNDQYWKYAPKLSGFEEGFAQGVSYACMNRYIELYPGDPYVNTNSIWLSDFDWDYDFQNVEELRTEDFWSSSGGTGIEWRRYEMAAAAMRKIEIENPDFYGQFNAEWYARLNADSDLRSSRELVINIIRQISPLIEGLDAQEWINKQYVFDCQIHPGRKIWVRTQHYPCWQFYCIYQRLFYYETFANGSEWGYWDGEKWCYHNLNGSTGTAILYDFGNNIVWQGNLLIEPIENPPVYNGIGNDVKNLINIPNNSEFPPEEYIGDLHELSLYTMNITFNETSKTIYRVIGDELVDFYGIWGGIIGANGGTIYIDHQDFPPEEGMPVVNGIFYGERSWAGVYTSQTSYHNTVPGKLDVRYIDKDGNTYNPKEVNIDYGSWNGNHIFLLEFTGKTPPTIPNAPTSLSATAAGQTAIFLTWIDNSTNETGFKIERKVTGSNYTQIDTVESDITIYPDLSEKNSSTTYYYKIRSYNLAGDSEYSNEISATTTADGDDGGGGDDDGGGGDTGDSNGGGGGGGGCFIATASFGSPIAKQVEILREFRDGYLLTHVPGRKFVGWYYRKGPLGAKFISNHLWAKHLTRIFLYPLIALAYLFIKGFFIPIVLATGGYFLARGS